MRGVAYLNMSSSETAEDPCCFRVCNVVDEPQERRAGPNERGPGLLSINSRDFPHDRVALVSKEGEKRRFVIGG
jgi:hypothetical protein